MRFPPSFYIILTTLYITTVSSKITPDEIQKAVVFIKPQIKNDNEIIKQLIADYICDNSPALETAIKNVSMNATFNTLAADINNTKEDINNAFEALQLDFTCLEKLIKNFPITFENIEKMKISLSKLLAAMNTHLTAYIYKNFWDCLDVNVFSLSMYRLNSSNDEVLFNILNEGVYNASTMQKAIEFIKEKDLISRINLFNGLINQTFVWNLIKAYGNDNLKTIMNTCGVEKEKLLAALNFIKPEIYKNFTIVSQLNSYFDDTETLGIIYDSKQIATHQKSLAFEQQNLFANYIQLLVTTYDHNTYTVTKQEKIRNFTSLTVNGNFNYTFEFGEYLPIIDYTCVYFTPTGKSTLQYKVTTGKFSNPYVWVKYSSPSPISILDGTPILCDDSAEKTIFYGLSLSNYVFPQNQSIKFDFATSLRYQTAVAGYVDVVGGSSGASHVGGAVESEVADNAATNVATNSTQNISPAADNVNSLQANKDASDNVDQSSDAMLKGVFTNKDVVGTSANLGSAAKPGTQMGSSTVQTAGGASKPVAQNSLVKSTSNNFNGVVAGPTTTLGNTTGSVSTQVTNQTAVSQLDQQASGGISGVGDTASNSALSQGGTMLTNATGNQVVGTVGEQSGAVKNSGSFADPGAVESGVGDLQGASVPNASVPVVG